MKTLTVAVYIIFFMIIVVYAQNDDIQIHPTSDYHQTENSITVDPTNPNNLLIATIGSPLSGGFSTPYYYSHDGGITWEGSDNSPNGVSTLGDPFVIYNYWGELFFLSKGNPGINFFKSTNKGVNWITKTQPASSSFSDKPHINVGRSISTKDHIYTVWTHAQGGAYKIYFKKSTDRGESWNSIKTIYSDPDEQGLGSFVCASTDGNIYVAFVKLAKDTGVQSEILVYRSTNGGDNFIQIYQIDLQGMNSPTYDNSYFNHTRVNSFPSMAVDNNGVVYIVYANNTSTEGGDIHIYLRKSSNQGNSWSSDIEIHNTTPGLRQWFPSISIDNVEDIIYVSYYNMVSGYPDYTSYRYLAKSIDNGNNFDQDQVSDVSFVPESIGVPGYHSSYMGDYYEMVAYNGMAYPCWSDNRTGIFQAYISTVGGAEIILDQKLSNSTTVDNVERWSIFDTEFKELEIPKLYHFKPYENQVLRGNQDIMSNEKYNKWNTDYDVKNHRVFEFEIIQQPLPLTSQFEHPYSMFTAKNKLLEVINIDAGKIKFRDPWFINYNDPINYEDQYGFKNLGSSAIYEWVNSPFNPNTGAGTGSEYKGIFLNQLIVSGRPYYSIYSAPHYINLSQTGRTHQFVWTSWEYDPSKIFVELPNNNSTNVVFLSNTATTITANLKGTQLSTQSDAYENNSQRKFLKTDDGDLHSVYESLGKVWYERSTDGGLTWEIMNSGNPIDSYDSKHPSIDFLPLGTVQCIVITYQRKVINNKSEVCFKIFDEGVETDYWYLLEGLDWDGSYNEADATPVVSISKDNQILFVWKSSLPLPNNPLASNKLKFSFGKLVRDYFSTNYHYEPWPLQQNKEIPNTTSDSKNVSIAIDKGADVMPFHLAYQESNTAIKYWSCTYNLSTGQLNYGSPTTCSNYTGFSHHDTPSIISMGTTARVCWVGYRTVYVEQEFEVDAIPQYRVLFRRPDQTTYWQFGNNVSNPNINKNAFNNYYAMAWSEEDDLIKFADNTLSTIRTITDVTGQQVQISNGSDKNNMYCMAFEHNQGVPFYFERSNNLGSFYIPLSKVTNTYFAIGREGVITVDSAGFYFAIGDVNIDGESVEFVEISDTAVINNQQGLNQYLLTEPMNISDNSSFLYSVQYGITDSLSTLQAITGERFINFKVQLVDDNTVELIGEFDNVSYTENNLYLYNNISYQVNTQGIGNRTVRLKLVVDNNFEADYSLSEIYSDESVLNLNKISAKQISYNGGEVIKSYELSQNYSNPFNLSTTIKFQIPASGDVSLKIYDILGNEIATLVKDFMETGKYEVNFNASDLASGVYIYRLNVNDFVNVKKMILLK